MIRVQSFFAAGVAFLVSFFSLAQAFEFKIQSESAQSGKLNTRQVANMFGCQGENLSPQLHWNGAPEGTKYYAITAYDPDAPTGSGFWHWGVYNIDGSVTHLSEGDGVFGEETTKSGFPQVRTDWSEKGFGGACPPEGKTHRYIFTIYALGEKLELSSNASMAVFGFMLNAKAIGKSVLTTTYSR